MKINSFIIEELEELKTRITEEINLYNEEGEISEPLNMDLYKAFYCDKDENELADEDYNTWVLRATPKELLDASLDIVNKLINGMYEELIHDDARIFMNRINPKASMSLDEFLAEYDSMMTHDDKIEGNAIMLRFYEL